MKLYKLLCYVVQMYGITTTRKNRCLDVFDLKVTAVVSRKDLKQVFA